MWLEGLTDVFGWVSLPLCVVAFGNLHILGLSLHCHQTKFLASWKPRGHPAPKTVARAVGKILLKDI